MNAYYKSLIDEIEKLMNEERYDQAYDLIDQELNMPYVPSDVMDKLDAYKADCKPYRLHKAPSVDLDMMIDADVNMKIGAVRYLKNLNLRQYHDQVQSLLESDLPDDIKGELIEALMAQKIDEPYKMTKFGFDITFIPSAISDIAIDPTIQETLSLFDTWFGNDDISLLHFCEDVLMQIILSERPFDQSDKDSLELSKAIVRIVFDAMSRSDEWPLFVKKYGLEKVEDIQLSIEK